MSKITMKYEFGGRGNFLKIQVEESDTQTQHLIKQNNREVWKTEKNIQRHIAKFSLNGDSLIDESSDPLIKRILQGREECFKNGLALLSEALSTLTLQQRDIFQLKDKDGLSFQAIAVAKGITHQVAQRHYQAAIKKLRDFYEEKKQLLLYLIKRIDIYENFTRDNIIKSIELNFRIYKNLTLSEKPLKTLDDKSNFVNHIISTLANNEILIKIDITEEMQKLLYAKIIEIERSKDKKKRGQYNTLDLTFQLRKQLQ